MAQPPANVPTLGNHILVHGVVPILGQLANFAATGATAGAAPNAPPVVPRLGLTKDGATVDGFYHFSGLITHITDDNHMQINFDDPADFSDGMLISLAAEGFNDMIRILHSTQAPAEAWPAVMTVLIANNEIYFSSSLKYNSAGLRKLFPNSTVVAALERCSAVKDPSENRPPATNKDERKADKIVRTAAEKAGAVHRLSGNCGEPSALQLYYMRHPQPPGAPGNYTLPPESRIVTWNGNLASVVPPCGSNIKAQQWGCERLTTEMNVNAIDACDRESVPEEWTFTTVHVSLST